jgi:tRNA nucleotidyltransferase (CCA-adding enzyme)
MTVVLPVMKPYLTALLPSVLNLCRHPYRFQLFSILRMVSRRRISDQKESSSKRRRVDLPNIIMPTLPGPPKINLTPVEETIRKLLVDAAAEIDSSSKNTDNEEPLTLRFTGGWVRDKLLGEACHDIDVGINSMTGFEFATRLSEFLADRHDKYNILANRIHKIESNPDKSKHLETATTKILNVDIDFVNLRTEVYSEESRIPQMVCIKFHID